MNNHYSPQELLEHWHKQQQAYVEARDFRTATVVMAVKKHYEKLGRKIKVLDLACGPGSLGTAILDEIEDAEVVGVDMDPILLRLANDTNRFAHKMEFIRLNLTDPNWQEQLPHKKFDAIVSATALHWLQPEQLSKLYIQLPNILNPKGIFLNADHLFYDAHNEKFLNEISWEIRDEYEAKSFAQGTMNWDTWWGYALSYPDWQEESELWKRLFDKKFDPLVKVNVEFHLASLRIAGFIETTQIYKWFDDSIVFGRIPDNGVLKTRDI